MFMKRSRYICFHSWKSLDVKAGLSRTLSIMATSPSLACERKGTSKELMQVMSHWQNQSRGWKQRMEGTTQASVPLKAQGLSDLWALTLRSLSTGCPIPLWDLGFSHLVQNPSWEFLFPHLPPCSAPDKASPALFTVICLHFSGRASHTKVPSVCCWSDQKFCVGVWDADTGTAQLYLLTGLSWGTRALHCKGLCKES